MLMTGGCSTSSKSVVRPLHFVCHVSSGGQSDSLNVNVAHASSAQTLLFVVNDFNGRSSGFDYLVRFTVRGGATHRQALVAASVATDSHTAARSVEGSFPIRGSLRLPAQYAALTPIAYDCPSPT
jgi:hypothetical protein